MSCSLLFFSLLNSPVAAVVVAVRPVVLASLVSSRNRKRRNVFCRLKFLCPLTLVSWLTLS